MSAYAERWLREIAATIKLKTQKSYGLALRLHILPALGPTKVRMLQKGRIKSFLVDRLQPRLDSAHRRYVREVVAYGKQGGREPARRRKW